MSRGTAMSSSTQRAPHARGGHELELVAPEDLVGGAGGGHDDVRLLELQREVVEGHRAPREALRQLEGALVAPVGHEQGLDPALGERVAP